MRAPIPGLPPITAGVADFTFSNTGEIIITSPELAQALQKAGGKKFVRAGRVKIAVHGAARVAAAPAARKRARDTMGPGMAPKFMARGTGSGKGYELEDNPDLDSMCMCDVKCPG